MPPRLATHCHRRGLIRPKVCAALMKLSHADAKVESTQRQSSVSFSSGSAQVQAGAGLGCTPADLGNAWMALCPVHKEAESFGGVPSSERLIFSPRFGDYVGLPTDLARAWHALGSQRACRAAYGSRVPVQVAGDFGCGVRRSERLKSSRAFWTRYAPHPASPRPATPWAVSAHAGQPTAAAHRCRRRLKSAVACGEANG